jgi:serine/threonine-protein kinase
MQGSQDQFKAGDRIGRYTVQSRLAEGGMGEVYRATGPHGEVVALKLLKSALSSDHVVRRRFDREARIAQRVTHPYVVPVLAVGTHAGIPYMAQMFMRGGSLAERLEREGVLSIESAVTMLCQVAGGLDAIHAAGLIHRDVKPANILLNEEGAAHIADFGLAKDSEGTQLTKPGQALGSLDYISPEQIRADKATPAADVYGLGCVMFACIEGHPPFSGHGGMSVLWAHLREPPPEPGASRPDMPSGLAEAILSALEKDAAARPQTASEYARLVADAARAGSRN